MDGIPAIHMPSRGVPVGFRLFVAVPNRDRLLLLLIFSLVSHPLWKVKAEGTVKYSSEETSGKRTGGPADVLPGIVVTVPDKCCPC